jgi:hypothetical protein
VITEPGTLVSITVDNELSRKAMVETEDTSAMARSDKPRGVRSRLLWRAAVIV